MTWTVTKIFKWVCFSNFFRNELLKTIGWSCFFKVAKPDFRIIFNTDKDTLTSKLKSLLMERHKL
jgi:hypothetical protein